MSASFGDLVRRGREEVGLSQSRLAHLVGKSPTTIRAWEHGRTNPSDPQAVAALAAVLGLDETELLERAGFEAPVVRVRPSARQELTSLATESTEMIALVPRVGTHERSKRIEPAAMEPDPAALAVTPPGAELPAGMETVIEPVPAPVPIKVLIPPADGPEPSVAMPQPEKTTPRPGVPLGKARIVVAELMAPGAQPGASNGFVAGRSYLEDEAERDFYRRRGAVTAVALVVMVIVIWWALGRTGGAIADLVESIVGALDI